MHAAAGDCERVRSGLVGQPVNTATSAAYFVAAAWVWRRAPRRRVRWTAALAAVGVGSLAYHGPGDAVSKAVHDSALVALLTTIGSGLAFGNRHLASAAAVGAAAAGLHASTRTGCRACRPDSVWQGHGLWHVLSAIAIAWLADGEREGKKP